MITPEFVRTMAQYNAWQNESVITALGGMDEAEITRDRGAFFGSILATLNHVLWGDGVWMSRLSDWPTPEGGIAESVDLWPDVARWRDARRRADARLLAWAAGLDAAALDGDLTWHSAVMGGPVAKSRALCIVHMFNHQTHHRGQVHGMLTAACVETGTTDLVFAPDLPK